MQFSKNCFPKPFNSVAACLVLNCQSHQVYALWQDFDEHNVASTSKNIDWKAAYDSLRPRVRNYMSNAPAFRT
ncbi:MAG TPA: hypothetical protein VM884_07500 [Flavisolibacter sp.]|nr:hypothetical protein [Flavisolibacter sp.]